MCRTAAIILKKRDFLNIYNPSRTVEKALPSSIRASLQHNDTWSFDASEGRKALIREFWGNALLEISEKYKSADISEAVFEQDIQDLKLLINTEYKQFFDPVGFKISHAQKSLSVFLKILWAQGVIKMPPLCPVDRTMLVLAGDRMPKAWTDVNTMADYRRQVLTLKRAARRHPCRSLACWELSHFNPRV